VAQQIFELKVDDSKIHWQRYSSDEGGGRSPLDVRKDVPLSLDPLTTETVELLVELQHLLADTLQNRQRAQAGLRSAMDQWAGLTEQQRRLLTSVLNELQPLPEMTEAVDGALVKLVRLLGQHLYAVLFRGDVHKDLMTELTKLKDDDLLRVELEFQGSSDALKSLPSWPWEYLYIPRDYQAPSGQFLALVTQLVMNRFLSFQVDIGWSFKICENVKMLLVVAAPPRDPSLGPVLANPVTERIRALKDQRPGVVHQLEELIEPEFKGLSPDYRPTATRENFEQAVVRLQPHIIHFIGHGQRSKGRGQVAFVGEGGAADWVSDEQFAQIVKRSSNIKLVFLQACESALPDPYTPISGMAQQLAWHKIPAVVAMQAKVQNSVANGFAMRFYEMLAEGYPVDCAVKEGREQIKNSLKEGNSASLAFGVPVLYLRSYQRLIDSTKKATAGPAREVTEMASQSKRACPRCGAPVIEESQKRCSQCGLHLWCANPSCPKPRLLNPLGNYCSECGTDIPPSPKWPREAPSEAPVAAPAESTAPLAMLRLATAQPGAQGGAWKLRLQPVPKE